eukprot:TRINITY_DN10899_c0_g1_i1.p1 TRINITY_DN10899_c0_g1~~TRINITY_DN10899_c0_g1_i1.p1  ORF type:complete len:361 (-),score=79.38 TRINITY_DN10899_c0_g1_i1:23-1105(-)
MGTFLTPKQIAKALKARGYGKQHLYCQMCRKQTRDENGFKCHMESEKHLKRMLEFGENQDAYVEKFSKEFEDGMMDIIRTKFRNEKTFITTVHHNYIRARSHTRLNGTRWETLDEFAFYLGKSGQVIVTTSDKGVEVEYVFSEAERKAAEDRIKMERKTRTPEEQMWEEMEKRKKAEESAGLNKVEAPTEIDLNKVQDVKFSFGPAKPKAEPRLAATTEPETKKRKIEEPISVPSDAQKETPKPAPNTNLWITEGIVVKIVDKKLADGKYYKAKGVIERIEGKSAVISLLDQKGSAKIDEDKLETVIPAIGGHVRVVGGKSKGKVGVLTGINEKKFTADVKLEDGTSISAEYEQISKLNR